MKQARYQMLVGLLLCGLFGFSAVSLAGWSEVEAVPTGRWGLAATAVGDKVYAIAGQDDSPKLSKVEAFDAARGKWDEGKEIPSGRVRHAAVTFKGKIYVFGGTFDGIAPIARVEEYDPKNDVWKMKAEMPTPRIAPMVVAMSTSIYVIGGATDLFFPSPAIEVYNPTTDTWETEGRYAESEMGGSRCRALQPKGKIYIFGGATDFTHENSTTEVDEYDTRTETWTPKAKLQRPLHNFSASFVNSGMIYVIGGQKWKGKGGVDGGINDPNWTFYDDVWEYSPEDDKWKRGEAIPKAKSSFGTAVVEGKIYVIAGWAGGAGDEIGVHVYQPPDWPFPKNFSVEPQNKLATVWGRA